MSNYNGWRNYETWNVALWIDNDETLYSIAREVRDYAQFVDRMSDYDGIGTSKEQPYNLAYETPDRVPWTYPGLDTDALDSLIRGDDDA